MDISLWQFYYFVLQVRFDFNETKLERVHLSWGGVVFDLVSMCCSCHEVGCCFFFRLLWSFSSIYSCRSGAAYSLLACMHNASCDKSRGLSSNFVAIVAKGSANCERWLAPVIGSMPTNCSFFFFLVKRAFPTLFLPRCGSLNEIFFFI